jgi:hypothetical protein
MISREQQEKDLEIKYLNQIVSFQTVKGRLMMGKVMRISFWPSKGEEMVHVQIANSLHEVDLDYFEENTTIL